MHVNLTEAEMAKLQKVTSSTEWNKVCDEIKEARGGEYPPDWFAKVVMSGLFNAIRVKNGW